jgi:hypothetical protein
MTGKKSAKKNKIVLIKKFPGVKKLKKAAMSSVGQAVQRQVVRSRITRSSGLSQLECYRLALQAPFMPDAVGAQVPDMYSAPTVSYHAEGTLIINSNASNIASLLLCPIPHLTAVDMTTASIGSGGMSQNGTTTTVWEASTNTNLSGVLASCRVVGAGFRIRNLLPPTSATGRVIVAPVALSGTIPTEGFLNTAIGLNFDISQLVTGIKPANTTVGYSSSILEFPGAEEYTAQDLIINTVELVCKPLTPHAFDFDTTTDAGTYNATQFLATETLFTTAGVVPTNGFNTTNGYGGWEGFMIRFEGYPASTSAIAEIEYILHYEGTPAMPTGAGSLIAAVPAKSHINIGGHQNVLSKALSHPAVKIIDQASRSAFNGYMKGGMAGAGSNLAKMMIAKLGISV